MSTYTNRCTKSDGLLPLEAAPAARKGEDTLHAPGFPTRIRVTYGKRYGPLVIMALDGPKRGRVIQYDDEVYLSEVSVTPWSVSGRWLPTTDRWHALKAPETTQLLDLKNLRIAVAALARILDNVLTLKGEQPL